MKRWLFTLAAAASLLLFLAVAALWVWSDRGGIGVVRSQVVAAQRWGRTDAFGFDSGRFVYWVSDSHGPGREWDMALQWYRVDARMLRPNFSDRAVQVAGFAWETGRFANAGALTDFYRQLTIPCWFLAMICLLLPCFWGRAVYRRWRRASAGCCPVCGYDLRATPDRCPECGAANKQTGERVSG